MSDDMQKAAYARTFLRLVSGLTVLMLTEAWGKLTVVCSRCEMIVIWEQNDKCIPQSRFNTGLICVF